ncbi:MAG: PEGA domain-containing protein [Myxococcales bacterium]|nr:PEGA domain-containing protein [Myxococcales bacterium]
MHVSCPRWTSFRALFCALTVTAVTGGSVLAQPANEDAQPAAERAATTKSASDDAAKAKGRKHFRMGVDFFREGDYAAALVEFKRAYQTAPHYKLKFNLGQTALRLQDYAYAIDNLTAFLQEGGQEVPEDRRRLVEEMISELNGRLAFVTIRSNQDGAQIYADDRMIGRTPFKAAVPIGAGRRKIVAIKDGYVTVERRVDLAARDELTLTMNFKPRPKPQKVVVTKVVNEDLSPVIWMGIGTGVLAAGTATLAILTVMAKDEHQSELERETTLARLETFEENARTRALLTDIGLGVTGAAAAATLVVALLLSDTKDESGPSKSAPTRGPAVVPSVATDGNLTQLSLTGRF